MTYPHVRGISTALLCAALLLCAQQASALSYELCDAYGAEWITDSPHLSGKYPYYSLLFFCNGERPPAPLTFVLSAAVLICFANVESTTGLQTAVDMIMTV